MNMKNKNNKIKSSPFVHYKMVYLAILFCFPSVLLAQGSSGGSGSGGVTMKNWLDVGTIPEFLSALFKIVAQIGAVALAFYIVYTGFLFVSAQGNEQALRKAKDSLTWVLIGGAIILGAWVLSEAVQETITTIGAA